MIFYSVMVNAWSLLYDELYGDDKMTEDTKITSLESDEYDPKPKSDVEDSDWNDPVISAGDSINIGGGVDFDYGGFTLSDDYLVGVSTASADTSAYFVDTSDYEVTIDTSNFDTVTFGGEDSPTPGIESNNPRKYNEDQSIKALQDYISTTYGGHYTSKENNVQTLDPVSYTHLTLPTIYSV